mmetsp:Transcript_34352/g.96851  ORF Transcript_34352/g.96851 Transcript_34352/m.96851 type:complete len:338 (+) Transcript_34352:133-1146(+)
MAGPPRERNHLSDVLQARGEADEPLETEAEASVGHCAIPAQIQVGLIGLQGHASLLDASLEHLHRVLTLGAPDELAHTRDEDVHCGNSLAVLVQFHVERLDLLGVVIHDHRSLEHFLSEPALVLAVEVDAPGNVVLEFLLLRSDGFHEHVHGFRVSDPGERRVPHVLQPLDAGLVHHLLEEFQVVHAVLQHVSAAMPDVIFSQGHVVEDVSEGQLGLDHPELCQVARGVGVLGPEGRPEGVHAGQGTRVVLALQLAAHREVCLGVEEVLRVVHLAILPGEPPDHGSAVLGLGQLLLHRQQLPHQALHVGLELGVALVLLLRRLGCLHLLALGGDSRL